MSLTGSSLLFLPNAFQMDPLLNSPKLLQNTDSIFLTPCRRSNVVRCVIIESEESVMIVGAEKSARWHSGVFSRCSISILMFRTLSVTVLHIEVVGPRMLEVMQSCCLARCNPTRSNSWTNARCRKFYWCPSEPRQISTYFHQCFNSKCTLLISF